MLHQKVSVSFLPTATKFHYIFNLRDMTNIFQGLLFSSGETLKQPLDLARAWLHETQRVYGDRLLEEKDLDTLTKLQGDVIKKVFEQELDEAEVMAKPNVFCHFARGVGDPRYLPIKSWTDINGVLTEALNTYNELNAAMNLVLFEAAMSDLSSLYIRAGMKNLGTVFLLTDAHIPDEKFLVLINDLLASGEIPDLFHDDEVENIVSSVRNEVKSTGMPDNRENCWRFFIDRVRRNLKIVLCFSPVGSTLRVRARQFPAIISCTTIDWFHEWPPEALFSVSERFLTEIPELPLLSTKHKELQGKIERLQNGLEKLRTTSSQVDALKAKLAVQEVELQKKNDEADKLIKIVEAETEKVSIENEMANEEKRKVAIIEAEVSKRRKECEEDLANLTELKSFGSPPSGVSNVTAAVMVLLSPAWL
ncbi:hypothetical protein Avbf_01552 [Armadillidium vulgare]|nr:hypothetical protein Avbf_01552 [Armadillidium vulgare]